jgi:HlyD family secretion protein
MNKQPTAEDVKAQLGLGANSLLKRRARRLLWAAGLIAVAATGFYFYESRQVAQTTVHYTTKPAAVSRIVTRVTATGTVQPTTQVDVSSTLSGILSDVLVDDNSLVKAGDVLAKLDTTKLEAQRARSAAQLDIAEAKLQDAQATGLAADAALERQVSLRKAGLSPNADMETATSAKQRADAAIASAKAEISSAKADLSIAENDLIKSSIISPIDGIVLKSNVKVGQTVASSLSAPVLFTLANDLHKVQIELNIDEADIGTVAVGQEAEFTVDAFPDRRFAAKVASLSFSPDTTNGVVTYKGVLSAANDDLALRPGMTTTARIIVKDVQDVLGVPNEAFRFTPPEAKAKSSGSLLSMLMPRPPQDSTKPKAAANAEGERSLYVLKDGAPEKLTVKPGSTDGKVTAIISGELKSGDEVILSSQTGTAK